MTRISDGELWARVRQGDDGAFADLFRRHAGAIHGYCFRRTGDWSRAEDLTSITFLEAWRRRSMKLDEEAVLPWLYGVATNVVRNSGRSVRRYRAALGRMPEPRALPDGSDEIADRLSAEQEIAALHDALRNLPRQELDVLSLIHWQDLTMTEAAAALGVPAATVRSRLSRAHARLRPRDVHTNHPDNQGAFDELA